MVSISEKGSSAALAVSTSSTASGATQLSASTPPSSTRISKFSYRQLRPKLMPLSPDSEAPVIVSTGTPASVRTKRTAYACGAFARSCACAATNSYSPTARSSTRSTAISVTPAAPSSASAAARASAGAVASRVSTCPPESACSAASDSATLL